ncbi:MAG TPA: L-lactate permease [Xanthobacteraceae bacterium]|nr:L-lactate permease [Xanthobacteraceae bacterium]
MAAVPIVVLLGSLGIIRLKAHYAAAAGLVAALVVAIFVFGMPASMAGRAALNGVGFGLLPIGWIIFNVLFLFQLTQESGQFKILQDSITTLTDDRRLQLLLIAFCFGAFFEGAAGGGTPVAVTGAILIGLGFSPLQASALSLIANTAPVAYGGLGTPIFALQGVTGLDLYQLSGMVGRQLPFFSLLVPFWLVWAFSGFRGMLGVWPAVLVGGGSFALSQFLVSNYSGPLLVDVVSALVSIAALGTFLRIWKPARAGHTAAAGSSASTAALIPEERAVVVRAWAPWIILAVFVFVWGLPPVRSMLDSLSTVKIPVTGLHELVARMPPVVTRPTPEPAIFNFNWLSTPGTGVFIAAIVAGLVMGFGIPSLVRTYLRTLWLIRYSLLTIACMLALGYVTRYSGADATLGLAFAQAGLLYPFFGTLLGWLGTALTGTDAASNVLFGSLQKISAQQLGLDPILMAAANSSGGVMGKMIDAQSIVVATTATRWYGHEAEILRYVFFHSLALASLVGVLVTLQAYVPPFTALVGW